MGQSKRYILLAICCASVSLAVCKKLPYTNYITDDEFEAARHLEEIQDLDGWFDPSRVNNLGSSNQSDIIEDGQIGTRNFVRNNIWPNQRVPYTLNSNLGPDGSPERTQVAIAFADYHAKTCIRFVPRQGSDNDYVDILRDDTQCGLANRCRRGGRQEAIFGGICRDGSTMIHELGHAICMGHEFGRPDRDDFIRYEPGCTPDPKGSLATDTNPSFFDYFSVMMYDGGLPGRCVQSKMNIVDKWFGNTGRLSVLDVDKINENYNCGGCLSHRWKFIDQLTANDYVEPAGTENGIALSICRFYVNGEIVVGKGSVSMKSCWVPYGGSEIGSAGSQKFEVLTNPQRIVYRWVQINKGALLPAGSITGGRKTTKGAYGVVPETYYIARCTSGANIIPGALHGGSRSMFYPSGGRANECPTFEVLTCG